MREDVKTEWVRRCKSGDYEQGKGRLKITVDGVTKYCCLGLVCDQAEEAGVIASRTFQGVVTFYDPEFPDDDYSHDLLPAKVVEWAELGSNNPRVEYHIPFTPDDNRTLAALNDEGVPFTEIGDLIGEQL